MCTLSSPTSASSSSSSPPASPPRSSDNTLTVKTMRQQHQQQQEDESPQAAAARHEDSIDTLYQSVESAVQSIAQTSVALNVAQAVATLSPPELKVHLDPVTRALRQLNARHLLQTTEPIHRSIVPTTLPMSSIRYLGLPSTDNKHVSMGIFVFPPNATIPLHDHPRMCVMSRVLYGRVHVKSFDWVSEDSEAAPASPSSSSSSLSALNLVKAFSSSAWSSWSEEQAATSSTPSPLWLARRQDDHVMTAGEVVTLYPTKGNIHEFTAGPEGAAVLDVLLPPYSDDDDELDEDFDDYYENGDDAGAEHDHRDCTYYRAEFYKSRSDSSSLYRLIPTPPPETFDCISGTYPALQWR